MIKYYKTQHNVSMFTEHHYQVKVNITKSSIYSEEMNKLTALEVKRRVWP